MPHVFTEEYLESIQRLGGLSKGQAGMLGVSRKKKWKKRLLGRELNDETFACFLSLALQKKPKGPAQMPPSRKKKRQKQPPTPKRVDYYTYLKSDRWRLKSRACLKAADFKCEVCDGEDGLNSHHYNYLTLGDERHKDLFCLCGECHADYHAVHPSKLLPQDKDDHRDVRLYHIILTIKRYRILPKPF